MACVALSVLSEPRTVLSMIVRLAVFTANSARPFDCGYSADESLWWIPHVSRNDLNSEHVNCDPPSLAISSGTPHEVNRLRDSLKVIQLLLCVVGDKCSAKS